MSTTDYSIGPLVYEVDRRRLYMRCDEELSKAELALETYEFYEHLRRVEFLLETVFGSIEDSPSGLKSTIKRLSVLRRDYEESRVSDQQEIVPKKKKKNDDRKRSNERKKLREIKERYNKGDYDTE